MNKYVPDELKDLSNSQQRVMRNVVNHLENRKHKSQDANGKSEL